MTTARAQYEQRRVTAEAQVFFFAYCAIVESDKNKLAKTNRNSSFFPFFSFF
jgi:hypothetical protein